MFNFYNSSVGKKFVIAASGILLAFFLVFHLLGNLTLFGGEEAKREDVAEERSEL